MTGVHGRSTTSSAMWFLGDDNACQRRGALDGQGSWIHDRDTLVALELCTDTSPARAALLGIDPTSGAERWRVSVPGFDAWAAGLDGPVPTLSSSPWPVTFHSLPSSAPTDEGETAEGGADKDGPSVPTDPGTDAFEVVVDGVGHRIATSTGRSCRRRDEPAPELPPDGPRAAPRTAPGADFRTERDTTSVGPGRRTRVACRPPHRRDRGTTDFAEKEDGLRREKEGEGRVGTGGTRRG